MDLIVIEQLLPRRSTSQSLCASPEASSPSPSLLVLYLVHLSVRTGTEQAANLVGIGKVLCKPAGDGRLSGGTSLSAGGSGRG